jgi:polyisoprenoid-binding protein YceI
LEDKMTTTTTEQVTTGRIATLSGTWRADVVHSALTFEVQYMGIGTFSGAVKDFDVTLEDGRLAGSARIASIDAREANLNAHLLSPEFFDAERHPELSFSAGELVRDGDAVELEGELTIKGITRPATLRGTIVGPVDDPYGNPRHGLQLDTTIDRTEFGILWNAEMPNGTKALSDQVTLRATLSLVQES